MNDILTFVWSNPLILVGVILLTLAAIGQVILERRKH